MPKPAPITRFSRFDRATDTIRHRIIANSMGEVGSGKTRFWLGAPAPIVILTFDLGLEGVIEEFASEKEIYVASYDLGLLPAADEEVVSEFTQDQAIEMREKVLRDYEAAIRDGAKTVVIDRESDFWNHCQYAEFGDPKTGNPKDWDALKNVERRMIAMAKASDINLGIIQGMRNEWVSQINKKTGTKGITQSGLRVPAGHDEIDALMHMNLMHSRVKSPVDGSVNFRINVGKSRQKDVQEQEYENLTWVEFAQLAFPDTTEEDWILMPLQPIKISWRDRLQGLIGRYIYRRWGVRYGPAMFGCRGEFWYIDHDGRVFRLRPTYRPDVPLTITLEHY